MTELVRPTATVGVFPASEVHTRTDLFEALEAVHPVVFSGLDPNDLTGLDAAVIIGDDEVATAAVEGAGLRSFIVWSEQRAYGDASTIQSSKVRFATLPDVHTALRGVTLADDDVLGVSGLDPETFDDVMAEVDGQAVWARRHGGGAATDLVVVPPPVPTDERPLRDHVVLGKFLALVPFIHFLREVTTDNAWHEPPVRACFLMDDPNFHASSYGWLDYRQVVEKGREHNFHLSVATVPLDNWLVRKNVKQLFIENPAQLSVAVHGNDHLRHELGRSDDLDHYLQLLATALRRMERLHDDGLPYDSVQVAPHNLCSPAAAEAMLRLGYEAVSITRSFRSALGTDSRQRWGLSDLAPHGLPVLERIHLRDDVDDMRLRAFLGLPIVRYGHHEDAVEDLDLLIANAEVINGFGPVTWSSLAGIARSNVATRCEGDTMRIRPHARRVEVEGARGVGRAIVELRADHPLGVHDQLSVDGRAVLLRRTERLIESEPFDIREKAALSVRLQHPERILPTSIEGQVVRPWALTRRMLTEARDRAKPRMSRVGASHG